MRLPDLGLILNSCLLTSCTATQYDAHTSVGFSHSRSSKPASSALACQGDTPRAGKSWQGYFKLVSAAVTAALSPARCCVFVSKFVGFHSFTDLACDAALWHELSVTIDA